MSPPRRIAFYSHDSVGLGHLRGNLRMAAMLATTAPRPAALLLAGIREAGAFELPPGVDLVTAPGIAKDAESRYTARSLDVSFADVLRVRSAVFQAALTAFQPDLLVVDRVPLGAFEELEPALAAVRRAGARCVLGLRDVLDDPAATRRDWERTRSDEAIRAYYDAVFVYGDPRVYDMRVEYGLSADVAAKVRFVGYHPGPAGPPPPRPPPFVLCMVGGGQDGAELALTFSRSELPSGHRGVIVTGPFMPRADRDEIRRGAEARGDMTVHELVPDPWALLQTASAVVSMGGYASVCELLACGAPALVVPRVTPRTEQLIRALRLQERGCIDVLTPSDLTPAAVAAWTRGAVGRRTAPNAPHTMTVDGLRSAIAAVLDLS